MLTVSINGDGYEVRVPFDVHYSAANNGAVIRNREPGLRRCACCDKCLHVERFNDDVHSFEEAVARGWLAKIDAANAPPPPRPDEHLIGVREKLPRPPDPMKCGRCGQARIYRHPRESCCRIRWWGGLTRLGRHRVDA